MSVRDYYNTNTTAFLRPWRSSSSTGAIHRALWAPGVKTREQAMHYVHELILERILEQNLVRVPRRDPRGDGAGAAAPDAAPALLVDLGCGVGATLADIRTKLAERIGIAPPDGDGNNEVELAGVTLSEVQADIARERLGPDVPIITGDFQQAETLEAATGGGARVITGAWMIESLVHATEAGQVLRNIARYMRRGAILLICDDLLASERSTPRTLTARENRWIVEFKLGWHVQSLMSGRELQALAKDAGFNLLGEEDLSPYVRNSLPRGVPVHAAAAFARTLKLHSPLWSNFRGGSALQHLGRTGIIRYTMLAFQRD